VRVLRAPWRRRYVTTGVEGTQCLFCRAFDPDQQETRLVVHRAKQCFAMMNLYPYSSGHVMVAPLRHVSRLSEASETELAEMMALARRLEAVLTSVYAPHAFNLGMNLGSVAGAGVEDHIHLHVVPRWNGDTNFMTVTGETRVVPEDPFEACLRLRAAFEVEGRKP
jgi:ATP adenylyltransferase